MIGQGKNMRGPGENFLTKGKNMRCEGEIKAQGKILAPILIEC